MIIDTHWSTPNPPDMDFSNFPPVFVKATLEGSLNRMDELGISKAVIWNVGRNHEETVESNSWTAKIVRDNPHRFIGFFSVYPPAGEAAIAEFERCLAMPEFIGLKLHPNVGQYKMNDPAALQFVRRARDLNLPIVTHVDSSAPEPLPVEEAIEKQKEIDARSKFCASHYLLDWVEIYDSPNVIAAHFGGVFDERLQASHITFQTAGASTLSIEYACKVVGVDRIMYGSDFPFFEPVDEIDKVRQANISEAAKKSIFVGYARNLLGLDS